MAFESNRVEIARLDEVLTMSARVHAATGESTWRERYFAHVGPLSDTLERTLDLAGSDKARTAISLVSDANDRLIAMEGRAFALVADGELASAFDLLTSADYHVQKGRYQDGLEQALEISRTSIGNAVDYHHSALILGVVAVFASLLVLTELWRRLSLSEQQEVSRKFEETLIQERQLSGLQRQFVSMVSHEFRTPLAIIDGTAQRLERRKNAISPEQIQHISKKIRATIERLVRLMESVLNLARLEEGRIEAVIEAFDLSKSISDIVAGYRDIHPGRTITLALDGTPESFAGDSSLLSQVISNLLSNALKYSDREDPVHLEAYSEGHEVVIAIHDRGMGISAEEIEKLGQRFFRASSSTGITGCGIGLHIANYVIELHGGRLDVQSTINVGSSFVVRLPKRMPSAMKEMTSVVDKQRLAPLPS